VCESIDVVGTKTSSKRKKRGKKKENTDLQILMEPFRSTRILIYVKKQKKTLQLCFACMDERKHVLACKEYGKINNIRINYVQQNLKIL